MRFLILSMALLVCQTAIYAQNAKLGADASSVEENRLSNDRMLTHQNLSSLNLLEATLEKPEVLKKNKDEYKGKYEFSNSNYFNYFLSPSAFSLPKKSLYFHNQAVVLINSIHYGFSDHFSLGMGAILFPGIFSSPTLHMFVRPRVSFRLTDKLYLGAGATIIHLGSLYDKEYYRIPFIPFTQLVVTYGNHDSNISLGAMYASLLTYNYYDEEPSNALPLMSLAGMYRFAKHFVLVSDNYFTKELYPDNIFNYIGMHGFRIIGRKNSFDIGLGIQYDSYFYHEYNPDSDTGYSDELVYDSSTALFPYIGYLRRF